MFRTITILLTILSPIYAYVGPGASGGLIATIFGIVGSIILAIFGILYYPIKRFLKKRRNNNNN